MKYLPQIPFTWNIVGPTGCGKTQMFTKVLKEYIAVGVFREQDIHLVCPTLSQDAFQQFTRINKYKTYDPSLLVKLASAAEMVKNKYGEDKSPNILVIYDDCYSSTNAGNAMRSSASAEFATHGRHYKINMVNITQQFYGVHKAVRHNGHYMSIFRPTTWGAAEDFLKDMVERDERSMVWKACKRAWTKKYNFVHLLTREQGTMRYREGFTKLLLSEEMLSASSSEEESSSEDEDEVCEEHVEQLKRKREGVECESIKKR